MKSRKWLNLALLASTTAIIASCNLYRTSDRDEFDNNGFAGNPPRTALAKPSTTSCSRVTGDLTPSSLAGLDLRQSDNASVVEHSSAQNLTIVHIAHRVNEASANLCRFDFATPVTDEEALQSSKALVETSL